MKCSLRACIDRRNIVQKQNNIDIVELMLDECNECYSFEEKETTITRNQVGAKYVELYVNLKENSKDKSNDSKSI